MSIEFFDDNSQVPKPKDEIKIEELTVQPYPDRFRVWLEIKVTPFQERPNLIVALRNTEGRMVGELNVIETMHANMEFTLHIRNVDDPAGDYTLQVDLFYETRNPPQDQKTIEFSIPTEDA
jgi:hypothetical protein